MAVGFRIYNTLTRETESFVPQTPDKVGVYVCGLTVYDHAHVGHARAMVVFDSFVRYLRHRGWDVTFVRNYTDVDDKIINRANETGEEPVALAQRFIDEWRADSEALGLAAPDHEPKVSERIPEILEMITKLVENGHAYASEGSVWFQVDTFDSYGKLSNQRVEDLRNPDEFAGKRQAADFALWKAAKPGEPAWESPWGPGRPGWHIECSAMSRMHLGDTLDIHGGGLDLVFPHHENEIAQSECSNHAPYSRYWMHNGMLTMSSGVKMGKSLGNVINIRDALSDYPAEALRLYYLKNHYRSPLPWSDEALPEALEKLARLYQAREVGESMRGDGDAERVAAELGGDAKAVLELTGDFETRFYEAMDNDFNTAQALGHLFELARAVNRLGNQKSALKRGGPIAKRALACFEIARASTALFGMSTSEFHDEMKRKCLAARGVERKEVDALVAERSAARADKDWARSDAIRDELEAKGVAVMDGADGTVEWRVRI